MLIEILIPWLASSALLLWVRIWIHTRDEDLSIVDAVSFTFLALIPIINVIYVLTSLFDEFSGKWKKIVILKRANQNNKSSFSLFSLIPAFNKIKTEIVSMGKYYAVRRTTSKLKIFKKVKFLSLSYSREVWIPKEHVDFKSCLTDNMDLASERLLVYGNDVGVPVGGPITVNDLVPMLSMAKNDPGLTDLLTTAKEWYILKKPT